MEPKHSLKLGIPIPAFGIPDHLAFSQSRIPGFRDYEKRTQCPNFTWYLPEKYPFPEFWGPIPGSKAESERTRPQHQVRDQGGHRSTGAIVLNKLCISLRYFTLQH